MQERLNYPIRVLHVVPTLAYAGAERFLVDLFNHLDPSKIRAHICSLKPMIPLANSIQTRLPKPTTLNCEGKELSRLRNWLEILALRKLMKRLRPDVIHSQLRTADIFSRWASWGLKISHVTTLQSTDAFLAGASLQSPVVWMLRLTSFLAHPRYVAISKAVAKWCSKPLDVRPEQITIIPNGSMLSRFVNIPSPRKRGDAPLTILCVARFDPVKNHRGLLQVSACLLRRGIQFRLRLVGEGALLEETKQLAATFRLEAVTEFLPPRQAIEKEYARSDIFVLNSNLEGQGIVLTEAMAAGLPVVATSVGGIPEVVRDGIDGFLVEPGQPEAMAERISLLAKNPELRVKMGSSGRMRAIEEFSIEKCARRYEEIFESAVMNG